MARRRSIGTAETRRIYTYTDESGGAARGDAKFPRSPDRSTREPRTYDVRCKTRFAVNAGRPSFGEERPFSAEKLYGLGGGRSPATEINFFTTRGTIFT